MKMIRIAYLIALFGAIATTTASNAAHIPREIHFQFSGVSAFGPLMGAPTFDPTYAVAWHAGNEVRHGQLHINSFGAWEVNFTLYTPAKNTTCYGSAQRQGHTYFGSMQCPGGYHDVTIW